VVKVEVENAAVVSADTACSTGLGDEQQSKLPVPAIHPLRDAALTSVTPVLAAPVRAELSQPVVSAFLEDPDGMSLSWPPFLLHKRFEVIRTRCFHERMFAHRPDVLEWAPWDSNPDLTG
jgi:hypothetical protein